MAKRKYSNRDSKDLNTNYTAVDISRLIEFKGTVEEFLSNITHLKPGYLKKPNGRNIIHLWWETSEHWFMNMGVQKPKKNGQHEFDSSSGWYIAKDMPSILRSMLKKQEFRMYLKQIN